MMTLHRNLTLGCIHSFFSMFLVLIPILVPFWKSLGLSIAEVLQIQAIFGLSMALFEIPTGYIADLWSRKASVCLGTFIAGCGFSLIPFSRTYEMIVLYEVIIALGGSLVSGADISIFYESVKNDPNRLKYLGALSTWSLVGEAVAGLLCSFLITWSYEPILWVQVAAGWAPFLVSLFYIEPATERLQHTSHRKNFGEVLRLVFLGESLTRLIFINALMWGLSTFAVVWLLQPYWELHSVPISLFGILWACLMFIAAFTSKLTHVLERHWGAPTLLLIIGLSVCIAYFTMTLSYSLIGVAACALFYVARGFASVIFTDAFNWKITSSYRATANSLRSFAFRLSYAFIGPAIGYVVDHHGLRAALGVLGLSCSGLFFALLIPLTKRVHELHVDYIPTE